MQARTSKPVDNKFYQTKSIGGYSTCIVGSPTDNSCNVLSNCVGYACGRFNEIIGSMKYSSLNCNAENFIERAKSIGLSISSVPVLGGIMVWQKGNTLSGNDGAGHVEVVERIIDGNTVYTSASNYGGTSFYNATRSNSNGRWGTGSGYSFRGCIINPSIGDVHYVTPAQHTGKTNDELANEVIAGKWGNGADRKNALTQAGYDYNAVQSLVNQKLNVHPASNSKTYHTVVKGDTLWGIAKRYYGNGSKYPTIAQANNISNPDIIYPGQKLLIP